MKHSPQLLEADDGVGVNMEPPQEGPRMKNLEPDEYSKQNRREDYCSQTINNRFEAMRPSGRTAQALLVELIPAFGTHRAVEFYKPR